MEKSISLAIALLLSAHGLRKKSLSSSGALTALIVGFLAMTGGTRVFGVMLIGFYLVGSRATKYGKQRKAKLEEGYHEGGYRSGWQVLSNSTTAVAAAFVWNAAFEPTSVHAALARAMGVNVARDMLHLRYPVVYDTSPDGWCPLAPGVSGGWSRALVLVGVGHFACCLGDTLASELGILSRGRPRLITTLRTVPPGTNGAMSVGGTIASVVGGAIVGLLAGLTLLLENKGCSAGILVESIGWGIFGGGFGSLLDSFLGATVQETRYSQAKGVVVAEGGTVVAGWNVLSNNQVNVVSSLISGALIGWVG